MQYKKKYFTIIAINILLILFILLFSIPAYKYLSKKNLNSNKFVKDQIIINPEAKSPTILNRVVKIKFIAKVDKSLDWEFEPLQENMQVKIGESKIIQYKS